MAADDQQFDAGQFVPKRLEQRQQVFVGEDHAVVGVIDDVFEIHRRKADVQRMQYRAHGRHGLVQLQVAIIVPHEAADPVADADTRSLQRVGQLVGPIPGLLERLPVRPVGLHRHDFDVRVELSAPAENAGHE